MKSRPSQPTLIKPALLKKWPLPELNEKLGKEGRGCVLALGGSEQNPGAIMLGGLAALRAGAGKLQIATARGVALPLAIAVPEARVIGLSATRGGDLAPGCTRRLQRELEACDALLVGPGMTDGRVGREVLARCGRSKEAPCVVLDAGALQALSGKGRKNELPRVVTTPHPGEMAKLWGCDRRAVLAAPLEIARRAAEAFNVVVALKGRHTFVVAPDGRAFQNTYGNVGLGTSGSGDVLAGIIAGLAARGADPLQAAVWGVYLHAKAGDVLAAQLGALGFLARELLPEIPRLLA
jgi:ADP-dependent NAD(P)H-hydrate dehydratase